ncbi:MAG: hypothetical protein AABY32_00625 [Nanoarchaeota archaeon]
MVTTIKYPVMNEIDVIEYQRQFGNVVRYDFNRFKDGLEPVEIDKLNRELNNIDLLDATIKQHARKKAESIYENNKDKTVIFGSKKNFWDIKYKKIDIEEYRENRLMPFYIDGDKLHKGNRKFRLDIIENNRILFRPNKDTEFVIQLPKLNKKNKYILYLLEELCNNNKIAFTCELTNDWISITYDENILKIERKHFVEDRILSIDYNPNYVGFTVCDYDKENNQIIIYKEIISIKEINDINTKGLSSEDKKNIYKNNKRKYEVFQINKHLIQLCLHYQVEYLVFEKLDIESSDKGKGRRYNKLCNNMWLIGKTIENIKKLCNIYDIKYIDILPHYSSFVGQFQNEKDFDSVAASLELGRRGNLYSKIYKKKIMPKVDIMYPKYNKEELSTRWNGHDSWCDILVANTWYDLYQLIKNSGSSYRVLFKPNGLKSLRLKHMKSKVIRYFPAFHCSK